MNVETELKDIKQLYNFEKKDGKVVGPKIKFPQAVYDRVKTFHVDEAAENGWTPYGIMRVILGDVDEKDYWVNPAVSEDVDLKPSEEFKQWMDEHHTFGPVLIMLAVIYNNYELED